MRTAVEINFNYRTQLEPYVQSLSNGHNPTGEDMTHLTNSRRNTITRLTVNGLDVVVKSFGDITLANRFIYAHWRDSKAVRSYHNALRLQSLGFLTPEPLACVDVFRWGFLRQSHYLCLHDEGKPMRAWPAWENSEQACNAIARLMLRLSEAGVCHHDLNASNLLWHPDSGEISLIDVNRARFEQYGPQTEKLNFSQIHEDDASTARLARTYALLRGDENPDVLAGQAVEWAHKLQRRKRGKRLFKPFIDLSRKLLRKTNHSDCNR